MNEDNILRPQSSECEEIVRPGKSYEFPDSEKTALRETYVREQQANGRFVPCSSEDTVAPSAVESVYQQLHGQYDMRVLELCPGTPGSSLNLKTHLCSLEFEYPSDVIGYYFRTDHALSLHDGKPIWYTAISYVWGESIFSEPVNCDGKDLKITRNLRIMLNEFRHTTESLLLWVDQVCINQQDLAEKTQQVLLMGKVYSLAQSTLVWLGPETDNTCEAIEMMKAIGDEFYMHIGEPLALDATGLPAAGSSSWSALSAFLSRPWFQRVWIIQEWVLSGRIRFQCGKQFFPEDILESFCDSMDMQDLGQYLVPTTDAPVAESKAASSRITQIIRTKRSRKSTKLFPSILQVIVEARGARATNPLDKVLGVMEMASLKVYPDYSKSVQEIYLEAARLCLQPVLSDLLCCVDHDQLPAEFPSWVPNWTQPRVTNSFGYKNSSRDLYKPHDPAMVVPREINGTLSLSGAIYESISAIVSPSQTILTDPAAHSILSDLPNPSTSTAQFILASLALMLKNCHPHPSAPNLYSAFWHTLVGDKDDTGWRNAPEDYADIFSVLLEAATGAPSSIPDEPLQKRRLTLANLGSRRPNRVYRQMRRSFETAVKGRVFGTTKRGFMGLFPRGVRTGDVILFFAGAVVPFIVRREGGISETGDHRFWLIGECYVHGLMQKTALDGDMDVETVLLV